MKTSFDFSSLVTLRKEDRIFSLMRKDARLEFFISFLYEAFESKNRKQILYDDFISMLRNFIKQENLNLQTYGIDNFNYENAYNSMIEYKLITAKIDWDKNSSNKYIVTTILYGDVLHFFGERAGNVTIGGVKQIEVALDTIGNTVALLTGNADVRAKYLEEKISSFQQELDSIRKSGAVRNLDKTEKRSSYHNICRELQGFGDVLNRGALILKKENDSVWEDIRNSIKSNEQITVGKVACMQFETLDKILNSETKIAFDNAVSLLANNFYKSKIKSYINELYKDKEIQEIITEDGLDIKSIYNQILKSYQNCNEEVNKCYLRLNSYMQSNEIKHSRELFKKVNELLAICMNYKGDHGIRRKEFSFYKDTLNILAADRKFVQEIKVKQKLVNKDVVGTVPADIEPVVFRDISVAEIPVKFKRLLEKYNGEFDLNKYITDEGTCLGIYEFITVVNIMNKYMPNETVLSCLNKEDMLFKIVDLVPLGKGKDFTEQNVYASNFLFNKEAYDLWEQDNFKI